MTTDNQIPFHWKCPVTCLSVDKLAPSGSIDTYGVIIRFVSLLLNLEFFIWNGKIFNEIEIKSHYEIASHSWTWWDILKFSDILGQDYVFLLIQQTRISFQGWFWNNQRATVGPHLAVHCLAFHLLSCLETHSHRIRDFLHGCQR